MVDFGDVGERRGSDSLLPGTEDSDGDILRSVLIGKWTITGLGMNSFIATADIYESQWQDAIGNETYAGASVSRRRHEHPQ